MREIVGRSGIARQYSGSTVANFEAILRSDGVIQLNYEYNDSPVSATVGISNGAGHTLAEDLSNLNSINTIVFAPFFQFGNPCILTITATVGGDTSPPPGTYSYAPNSTAQVFANPYADYLFDHWELDDINVGSANPCTVIMDKDHALEAVFSLVLHVDVNNDGTANLLDLILIAKAFGTFPGDPNYNSSADINRDGRINILDLILVATHLGQHGL